MKGIRRSLNKERIGNPTPTYSSLPTAGFPSLAALAPVRAMPGPPRLVIRATTSSRTPDGLAYEAGDFYHVVSDDGGEDWFDAANPMTGMRGLVPASHFQVLGRNVRETAQRKASLSGPASQPTSPQLNGHSSSSSARSAQPSPVSTFTPAPQLPQSSAVAPPKSQPLYGIVQYDFVAERADELDAKRGEPIIVIAQSNHEWFVAKPIGRLGGPGLIPVAFVEIQDMTTGKPVENIEELIRSAVVPQVEEWKKMTADYKSASIPLGRFDFAQGSVPVAGGRTSQGQLGNGAQAQQQARDGVPPIPVSPAMRQQNSASSNYDNGNYARDSPSSVHHSLPPASPTQSYDDRNNPRYSYSRERMQYGLVTAASVESFHQEEGSFWFHLRAYFSTGASLVLYRLYQDFYDFQIALMDEFPVEAGRIPPGEEGRGYQAPERILPMMPGPTDFEDEVVCAQRVHDLSVYLTDLCALPDDLRGSGLMYEFLVPRAGDVEVAVGNGRGYDPQSKAGKSTSIEGQYGELVEYLDSMEGQDGAATGTQGVEDSMRGLNIGNPDAARYSPYASPKDTRKSQTPSGRTYSTSSNPYSPSVDGQSLPSLQDPLTRRRAIPVGVVPVDVSPGFPVGDAAAGHREPGRAVRQNQDLPPQHGRPDCDPGGTYRDARCAAGEGARAPGERRGQPTVPRGGGERWRTSWGRPGDHGGRGAADRGARRRFARAVDSLQHAPRPVRRLGLAVLVAT